MLGKVDHIGIVVPDINAAIKFYEEKYGVKSNPVVKTPTLNVAFLQLENTKIELLQPLDKNADNSQANYLRANPQGGIHHMAYEVANLKETLSELKKKGCLPMSDISEVKVLNEIVCYLKAETTLNVLTELVQYV